MTILTTKTIRRSTSISRVRQPDLTLDEQANVRRAIRFLDVRLGRSELAARLDMTAPAVRASLVRTRPVSAALALRAARVAEVKIDAVLSGEWPPEGACAHGGAVTAFGGTQSGQRLVARRAPQRGQAAYVSRPVIRRAHEKCDDIPYGCANTTSSSLTRQRISRIYYLVIRPGVPSGCQETIQGPAGELPVGLFRIRRLVGERTILR